MIDSDEISRVREQVIARFADACAADDRVVAAFVGGSIARGDADRHSDIDLCVVTTDADAEAAFADHEALVARLGAPLFIETWGHENPEVFVILDDGTDLELFFVPEGRLHEMQVGPILDVIDRIGVLRNLEVPVRAPSPGDLAGELRRLLAWFWHDVSHFIKALGRGQLWWAAGEVEALRGYCVNLVRLEQALEASEEPYFKIDDEASTEALDPLRSTFVPMNAEALGRAALELVEFFGVRGRPLAESYGLAYPNELDRLFRDRLRSS